MDLFRYKLACSAIRCAEGTSDFSDTDWYERDLVDAFEEGNDERLLLVAADLLELLRRTDPAYELQVIQAPPVGIAERMHDACFGDTA